MAYTCSGGICRGTDAATTAAIQLLQRQTNRFATDPDIGFDPIGVDGLLGAQTVAAALYALTSINLASDPILTDTHLQDVAGNLIDMINGPEDILLIGPDQNGVSGPQQVANVIATGADLLGRPGVDQIQSSASSPKSLPKSTSARAAARQAGVLAKKPAVAAASLLGVQLPNWAIWASVGGIGLWVIHHYTKKYASSSSKRIARR